MSIQLDNVKKIEFPVKNEWWFFYEKWFSDIVNALGFKHGITDREDAVSATFVKLASREGNSSLDLPHTEKKLFGYILWQAKGMLSHMYEAEKTRKRYHLLASDEYVRFRVKGKLCRLDEEKMHLALYNTMLRICEMGYVSKRDMEAYSSYCLKGESGASVSKKYKITVNNLYQKKLRINNFLKGKGRKVFLEEYLKCIASAA